MRVESGAIPGCVVLPLGLRQDERGHFVKLYQRSLFEEACLNPEMAEVFVSRSVVGAVRGLHFQVPPSAHAKTMVCLDGRIFDVVVDLRVGSPTFRSHTSIELDATTPVAVHIPVGCAHGFQSLSEGALMAYAVSTEHAPDHDTGIRWDTAGIAWPISGGVVSIRDRSFRSLDEFESPFLYSPSDP